MRICVCLDGGGGGRISVGCSAGHAFSFFSSSFLFSFLCVIDQFELLQVFIRVEGQHVRRFEQLGCLVHIIAIVLILC